MMRMARVHLSLALVAALAVTAGCGSDDGTGPGSGISDSQASMLASHFVNAAVGGLNAGPSGDVAMFTPIAVSEQYFHRVSCPLFGRTEVSGSISGSFDSETGSGSLWMQWLLTATDCTFSSNAGDLVVNGDPYLSLTGTFTFLNGAPATQQTLRLGGALRWDYQNGGSGFCAFNLTINLSTAGSGTTTVSGTVCGRQVNLTS
jgi:hypothetical protein